MKALVYDGPGKKAWKDVPKPEIQNSTDAIVKITGTTICGSDLHILKGDVESVPAGRVLGHEGVGIIESVGDAVKGFKPNDRVLISCITSCGTCVYCRKNLQAHCLDGGWKLGNAIDGTQAEYVRIPYADTSLYSAPSTIKDDSLIMLSDALPTGYEIGVLSGQIQPGDTVAVVGCGPVGMSALLTAQFFSPAKIIAIDYDDDRLVQAKALGASHTINPSKVESVSAAIEELRSAEIEGLSENQKLKPGVDVAIEAVGIPGSFLTCQEIIAPGGRIANIGVHGKKVDLHLEDLWTKNVNVSTGLVSANSTSLLLNALKSGKIDASSMITHRFKLGEIEEAYEVFANASKNKAIKMFLDATN